MAGLQVDAELAALSETQKHIAQEKHIADEKVVADSSSQSPLEELDGIHDGLEFPTDEDRATLRRVADSVPWNAYCTLA